MSASGSGMIAPASWQSHLVNILVRRRMRPHALRPIDPTWVRAKMGSFGVVRSIMAHATGARLESESPRGSWVGGERLSAPGFRLDRDPVLLYLHGGGFIGCSPATHRPLVGSLVRRLHATAWVPRYRLAPEHPFPCALDDALDAYRYLIWNEGVAHQRLIIAGDSAGGGLALSVVMAARDRGWPVPAGVVAYSPWTDLAGTGASLEENSDRCAMFAGSTIRRAAVFYAGDTDLRSPYLSPLYGDFRGFPPVLLHASTDEVLRDDSVRTAARALSDGVTVELRLWKRVPHVWQFFPAVLPEARQSLDDTQRFVSRLLDRGHIQDE